MLLLAEGQTGEAWEGAEKGMATIGGVSDKNGTCKFFTFVFKS
jgi:hypothetical protein